MGFWKNRVFDVPHVRRKPWGILCGCLNIIPGTGTMLAAANQENMKHYLFGWAQLLLFWLVVPYIWSLVEGILIIMKSE